MPAPALNDWELLEGRAQDLLPGPYAGQVDCIVTSPPYDGLREYAGVGMAAWDFEAVAAALIPCLAPGGVLVWVVADAIVDGSETGNSYRQALAFLDAGLRLHQTLIFEKAFPRVISPDRCHFTATHMWVFANGKPAVTAIPTDRENLEAGRYRPQTYGAGRHMDRKAYSKRKDSRAQKNGRRSDIWRYSTGYLHHGRPDENQNLPHEHPATFPYALAADHIRTWTPPGGLVLDPMAGSGTTLRAAVDLGRRAVGVEVVPEYCDLIRRRMAQPVLLAPESD